MREAYSLTSTAPWDQPRNATTVTLYLPDALTASESDLIAHLQREHRMREVEIEVIHFRKPGYDERGPSVCCLISWRNLDYNERGGRRGPLAYNQPPLPLELRS